VKVRNFQKIDSVSEEKTFSSFVRVMFFTTFFPLENQNSLASLALMDKTLALNRIREVFEALGNCGSFSRNFARSAQSKS
jgi:hypothetical protein